MRILVTGAAGFIGSNLVLRLFKEVNGATIIGIDNMNDYYDVRLKEYRLSVISTEAERSLDLRSGWHEKSDKIGTKTSLFRGTPRWQKQ